MNGLVIAERPRCQLPGCPEPVLRVVDVVLPGGEGVPLLRLPVRACWRHAAELEGQVRAMEAARRQLSVLLQVLESTVARHLALRQELDVAQSRLLQAEADLVEARRTAAVARRAEATAHGR